MTNPAQAFEELRKTKALYEDQQGKLHSHVKSVVEKYCKDFEIEDFMSDWELQEKGIYVSGGSSCMGSWDPYSELIPLEFFLDYETAAGKKKLLIQEEKEAKAAKEAKEKLDKERALLEELQKKFAAIDGLKPATDPKNISLY